MKSKRWLTIITLAVSIAALAVAIAVGKDSNNIIYDISLALFGSAALGFIMSITEYYVEKRRAMEEFWFQARNILKELRKIKYFTADAPSDLIIGALYEEYSNEWKVQFGEIYSDKDLQSEAKNKLISWYEKNTPLPFNEHVDYDNELELFYNSKMDEYRDSFIQCMDSYRNASSVDLGGIDNAYGNLDFIFANHCIRDKAYKEIFNKMREIIFQYRTEVYHFNLLKEGKGSFPVCASKILMLNRNYFISKQEEMTGYAPIQVYQNVFDEIESALEEFRCIIYNKKYVQPKHIPVSGKLRLYVGESGDNTSDI